MFKLVSCVRPPLTQACDTIHEAYPDEPLPATFTLETVRSFARGAMDRMWYYCGDSMDERPHLHSIDIPRFITRYIPNRADLPIRPFTRADPYDEHPDEPWVIWLDPFYNEVPPPPNHLEIEAAALGRHPGRRPAQQPKVMPRDHCGRERRRLTI